jgi:tRNA(Arg) A34 adenosine deaminase TadA
MNETDRRLLARAIEVAQIARAGGNHPFGAVLGAADGQILIEAGNTVVTERDVTGHAELNLVRAAGKHFEPLVLAGCTLYSSCEPCAMCAGGIYWSGIGRVVYALSEAALYRLTGDDPENPTMSLGTRAVLSAGQRPIEVEGPFESPAATAVHEGFWRPKR